MNTQPLKDLSHGLVHLFYPRLCEGCRKPLMAAEKVLCIGCALEIPETGYHHMEDNETALRFAGRVPFVQATSLAYFTQEGLLQHLLHGLKYKGKKETGYYLGRRLAISLHKNLSALPVEDAGGRSENWISSVDMIIPVPLHKDKKAKRGFNQSLLVAEGMSEVLHIPVSDNILERVRDTESQTHKTRAERVANMTDAFRLKQTGLLTTGATLEACALALMKEESIKISIATVGIAVS
jgi:predicted amidophosphoribosyltransferase